MDFRRGIGRAHSYPHAGIRFVRRLRLRTERSVVRIDRYLRHSVGDLTV
jgi:hypothetical protein